MTTSRIVMVTSSLVLAAAGTACLFLPAELLVWLDYTEVDPLFLQLIGALYLGFAAANWTARGSMIGGIYSRPLSIGNLMHFFVGTAVVVKQWAMPLDTAYLIVAIVYAVFAVLFAWLLFSAPRVAAGKGARKRR
ncbi:MAG: hypothetical protein R3305_05915 [Gammaproteobacteria bacterium]|nr:hypothetical protein [Gammaproteobacteria bacterium]